MRADRSARREQIMAGAVRCFLLKGFRGTSMRDVCREVGLSMGAVYTYFEAKDEIVEAVAVHAVTRFREITEELLLHGPLPADETIGRIARRVEEAGAADGVLGIVPQVWTMRGPSPRLREATVRLRATWVEIAARMRAAGLLAPEADPWAVGPVMMGALQGFLLQRLVFEDADPERLREGVAGLAGLAGLAG